MANHPPFIPHNGNHEDNPPSSAFFSNLLILSAAVLAALLDPSWPNAASAQHNDAQGEAIHALYWGLFAPIDTIAQWAMAAFSALAVGVSIWAVRLVRDTLAVNRAAVAAAVRAAEAADRAVDVTREMGAAQTRAYLVVTDGEVIYDRKGPPTVYINIRNTGQSPAFEVEAVYQVSRREHFTAAPTGAKGGLKVAKAPMAQMIGGGGKERLTILSVIVTDDTVIDSNTPDFSIEGVIEYKTVSGENSWDIDARTSFLLHTVVDRNRLATGTEGGKPSRHPLKLMPAFKSGWAVDYQRTIADIREGERKAKAKADAEGA